MLRTRNRCVDVLILAGMLTIAGCASSAQVVSEGSVEDKVTKLKIGQTTRSEVARIFGSAYGEDQNRWVFYFADTAFEISNRNSGLGHSLFPLTAGVVPTNTRALVAVSFDGAGIIKRFEVERFFDEPYVNDYWYLIKDSAKQPLESIAGISESLGFKVVGIDKTAGTFALVDDGSNARIEVKLEGRTLRITSRNPHHRQANEYRVHTRRESALASKMANSEIVQ